MTPTPHEPAQAQDGVHAVSARTRARQSLSALRVVMLLCVAVPLLVYIGVGIYRYGQVTQATEIRLDRALRIAREHALRVLESNETLVLRVRDLVDGADARGAHADPAWLHTQLSALIRDKPQIQSVWVIGPSGRPVATSFMPAVTTATDFSDRDYFQYHARKGGGVFVSSLLFGKITKVDFFDMSMGRYAPDGGFRGVVTSSLLPSYFQKFHTDLVADEPGMAITVFREDGAVYSRWPELAGASKTMSPTSPVLQSIRAGNTTGVVDGVSSLDQRSRVIMYSKIGNYPLYVGTGMDRAEMRASWREEMALLAAFGIPPVVGLFLAAWLAARRTREALAAAERLQQESVARRQVEEALLQSQKLEALGRLTGGVAHDFNNALMVITGNLHLLRRTVPGTDGPHAAAIARAVDTATKLTRQLLAFSRKQPLMPEHYVLQQRLPALDGLLHPVLGSQVLLRIMVAPGTRPIQVDAAEMELALINLAINARDAMPEGGSFDVDAADALPHELPPGLHGEFVMVQARDTGSGIPPEALPHVFEPFFTTKPVGSGTGLGLSQVYGLAARAGGTATIASTGRSGTAVRLFFPASPHAQDAPQPQASAPAPVTARSVLMVEDNDEVSSAVLQVLQSLGCSVTRLDRGYKAIPWLEQHHAALPEMLLTDVVMPGGVDGLALARHVRERHPGMRIIMMSGYAEQLESISGQGFDVLPKPFSADMLAAAMQRIFARA